MGWNISQLLRISRGNPEVMKELQHLQAKNDALDKAEREIEEEMAWDAELEVQRKKRLEDDAWVEAEQARLDADDARDKEDTKIWVPPVEVSVYAVGDFLAYEGQEWPRRFITGIDITEHGKAPQAVLAWAMICGLTGKRDYIRHVQNYPALITVTLSSGQKTVIETTHNKVLFLHEALVHGWKHQGAV